MKKSGKIDNPWALAWYMKNRGAHPAKHDEDAAFDAPLAAALQELSGRSLPAMCLQAARGDVYAMNQLLAGGLLLLPGTW